MGVRNRLVIAAPFLAAGLLLAQSTAGYAAGAISVDTPYSASYVNACNGDAPLMVGVHHMVLHTVMDSNGGLHLTSIDNYPDLKSDPLVPTASGSSYVVSQIDTFTLNESPLLTAGMVLSVQDRWNVISIGPAPNFHHDVHIHLTVNANGVPTAQIDDISDTCTG